MVHEDVQNREVSKESCYRESGTLQRVGLWFGTCPKKPTSIQKNLDHGDIIAQDYHVSCRHVRSFV